MGNITDLVGLACGQTARNGANRKITAQICADMERKEREEVSRTAVLLSYSKKLSNSDWVAG